MSKIVLKSALALMLAPVLFWVASYGAVRFHPHDVPDGISFTQSATHLTLFAASMIAGLASVISLAVGLTPIIKSVTETHQ